MTTIALPVLCTGELIKNTLVSIYISIFITTRNLWGKSCSPYQIIGGYIDKIPLEIIDGTLKVDYYSYKY